MPELAENPYSTCQVLDDELIIKTAPAGADAGESDPLIMILWTEQFKTGSEQLDQQHRMLIDHINLLEEQLQNLNPNREETAFAVHLVDYLEAYANVHFKDEEKCMESHRCPAHAQNRREHERFRGFIHNYKRLCELEGFKLDLLKNLHELIRTWIQDHILKIDTQLRPCISPFSQSGSGAAL